jgi:hypothetical protein
MFREAKQIIEHVFNKRYDLGMYLWIIFIFFILYKLWKIFVLALILTSVKFFFLIFLKDRIEFVIDKKKLHTIIITHYKINIVKAVINVNKTHDNKFYIFVDILFRFLFNYVIGFGFKFLKLSIFYYSIAKNEYEYYHLKNKKIRFKIWYTFFKKTIYCTLHDEFVKNHVVERELKVFVLRREKIITITIIS